MRYLKGKNYSQLVAESRLECTRRGAPPGGRGKIRNRNRNRRFLRSVQNITKQIIGTLVFGRRLRACVRRADRPSRWVPAIAVAWERVACVAVLCVLPPPAVPRAKSACRHLHPMTRTRIVGRTIWMVSVTTGSSRIRGSQDAQHGSLEASLCEANKICQRKRRKKMRRRQR